MRPGTMLLLALLSAVATVPATAQPLRSLEEGDLVLRGGWIFDGTGDAVEQNRGIVIRSGKLLLVNADLAGIELSAARVMDLEDDQYVLPGLFDLHAHYAVDLFGEGRVDEMAVYPTLFLANGVTSTFPAGEMDPEAMRALRLRIAAGEEPGPRIYNSGPYFGTARPGWRADAMTPDSIRREVDHWAARGAKGFKAKGIRPEQLRALIDQAHRHGLTVTGHLDSGFRNSVNPRDAIRMGIDRIEHFSGGDAISGERSAYASLEQLDATSPDARAGYENYIRHGAFYDATLSAYGYWAEREPPIYEYWVQEMDFLTPHARRAVESRLPRRPNAQFERIHHVKKQEILAFYEAGGGHLITLGTDHPSWGEFFSGFGAHRELHAMVLSGIPPAAALRIGTINGARALGMADRLGTIESGKLADLFIIRGNPLADIRNTRNVRWVIRGGTLYDAPALLESMKGRLGPAGHEDEDRWKGTP